MKKEPTISFSLDEIPVEEKDPLRPRTRKILNLFPKDGSTLLTQRKIMDLTRIDGADLSRELGFLIKDGYLEKSICSQCCTIRVYRRLK